MLLPEAPLMLAVMLAVLDMGASVLQKLLRRPVQGNKIEHAPIRLESGLLQSDDHEQMQPGQVRLSGNQLLRIGIVRTRQRDDLTEAFRMAKRQM